MMFSCGIENRGQQAGARDISGMAASIAGPRLPDDSHSTGYQVVIRRARDRDHDAPIDVGNMLTRRLSSSIVASR
jgi:hypothetical protein